MLSQGCSGLGERPALSIDRPLVISNCDPGVGAKGKTEGKMETYEDELDGNKDAYTHAIDHRIYPILDEDAGWFCLPITRLEVTAFRMLHLANLLAQSAHGGGAVTFYQLERRLSRHPLFMSMRRGQLIAACRYFCMHGLFTENFWRTLVKGGGSPVEAGPIVEGVSWPTRPRFRHDGPVSLH